MEDDALTDWSELSVASVGWPQAGILGHESDGAPPAVDADFLCAAFGVGTAAAGTFAGAAPPEDGRALRCVDEHHPADCARCTPPPGPTEADFYVLRKDRGAWPKSRAVRPRTWGFRSGWVGRAAPARRR